MEKEYLLVVDLGLHLSIELEKVGLGQSKEHFDKNNGRRTLFTFSGQLKTTTNLHKKTSGPL